MKQISLKSIAEQLKNLDFCMLVTQDARNGLHSRPMSNNRNVDYDGDSWFFTYDDSRKVRQVEAFQKVSLIYQGEPMLFIEVYGDASIVKQRSKMEERWVDELEQWFPQGIDTPGICLLKVTALRIQVWDKNGEGEYKAE